MKPYSQTNINLLVHRKYHEILLHIIQSMYSISPRPRLSYAQGECGSRLSGVVKYPHNEPGGPRFCCRNLPPSSLDAESRGKEESQGNKSGWRSISQQKSISSTDKHWQFLKSDQQRESGRASGPGAATHFGGPMPARPRNGIPMALNGAEDARKNKKGSRVGRRGSSSRQNILAWAVGDRLGPVPMEEFCCPAMRPNGVSNNIKEMDIGVLLRLMNRGSILVIILLLLWT